MITDDIVRAICMMIDMCEDRSEAAGMDKLKDMLCDFDSDVWPFMSDEEQKVWVKNHLT